MIDRLLPAAVALLALPAAAQVVGEPRPSAPAGPPACETTAGSNSCARVLACIGSDGLWFDGRAVGWNHGTVAGTLSDGSTCTGEWAYTSDATSRTVFSCDSGISGAVVAVAQDSLTGTTTGQGSTTDGRTVIAWSGNNVLQFLGGPDGRPRLPCTDAAIPIS